METHASYPTICRSLHSIKLTLPESKTLEIKFAKSNSSLDHPIEKAISPLFVPVNYISRI